MLCSVFAVTVGRGLVQALQGSSSQSPLAVRGKERAVMGRKKVKLTGDLGDQGENLLEILQSSLIQSKKKMLAEGPFVNL